MIDYTTRRKAVQRSMANMGIDLLAVWPGENMHYLLGYHPRPDERLCFLFLTPDEEGLLVPELNAVELREHVTLPLETYTDEAGPTVALSQLADRLNFATVKTLALDETMRTDFTLLLLEQSNGAHSILATSLLGGYRMRKDKEEIALIQQNAVTADRAMQSALAAIRVGATEREVADMARETFSKAGVDRINFTIVASGPNGAFPHHYTGKRVLQPGDAVVIDVGAREHGYNSDITRMAYVGNLSQTYLKVHEIVDEALQTALSAVRPGVMACDIDKAARSVIARAGYGDYFVHRTGHGLGLNGHEPPYVTESSELILEEGMVFSIEPGVYLPGEFGVRLEEIVAITSSGVHVFSQLSREVHCVAA